jgi:hypothetical protein
MSPIKNRTDVLNFREATDSFLVIEFKTVEEPPAINVLPPLPVKVPPPQVLTVSVAIQTVPVETSPLPKKLDKEKERPPAPAAMPPELRKELVNTPLSQGLGIRSEIKT